MTVHSHQPLHNFLGFQLLPWFSLVLLAGPVIPNRPKKDCMAPVSLKVDVYCLYGAGLTVRVQVEHSSYW